MKSNQIDIEIKNKKELQQMTKKIIERYQIKDYNLALNLAQSLYKNGIKLDQLTEENYIGPLNLDQIILYLIQKEERKNKIIPIHSKTEIKTYQITKRK